MTPEFKKELEVLVNRFGVDNDLNLPDYRVSEYIMQCLGNYKVLFSKPDDRFIETEIKYDRFIR